MFCSFYLILYIIWFQFSSSLSPFYYFDYYEHQYFTSVLFHMFSFIKNALFGSYSWMSHRTFIESSAVTTAFWLDQYGGRFASIFRRCPPSMFWGQWARLEVREPSCTEYLEIYTLYLTFFPLQKNRNMSLLLFVVEKSIGLSMIDPRPQLQLSFICTCKKNIKMILSKLSDLCENSKIHDLQLVVIMNVRTRIFG